MTFYYVTLTFSVSLNVNSNLFFTEFSRIEEELLERRMGKDPTIGGNGL